MKSRINYHVDYNGNPTINLSVSNDREDMRDILVNNLIDQTVYPNGYYSKPHPIKLPKGVFVIKELFDDDTCGSSISENQKACYNTNYTLVPLNRINYPYVFNEDYQKPKEPYSIISALEEIKLFFDLLRYESKALNFLKECLPDNSEITITEKK